MCTAFASRASNTGFNSPGELEMTFSTSEVAVCCSSDSKVAVRACTSSNRRTFSIAITAWSAKVSTSSICLSVNGRTILTVQHDQRRLANRPGAKGDTEHGAIAADDSA